MPIRLPRWLPSTLILGVPLAFVLLWGSGRLYARVPPGEAAEPAPAVAARRVAVVEVAPVAGPDLVERTGTVAAERMADVAAKIVAPVLALGAQEGDRVRAGAVLAELDGRDLEAETAQAASALARAQAATGTAAEGGQAAAGAQAQARARVALAEATLARIQALHAEGGASDQALTEAQGEQRMARAALDQAARQRGVSEGQRREAVAQAAQAAAGLRRAATTRAWARVVAPFDGLVVERRAEVGAMAAPGVPLFRLAQGPYRLDVAIDERLAASLAPGASVPVVLEATAATLAGRLLRVVPAVDPASRTAIAKVRLPDHPALRAGMAGRGCFEAGRARRLLVPASVVVRWYHLTNVFAVDAGGRARLRLVRLGAAAGDRVEALAGVEPGDRLVLAPPADMRDGDPVEATP